MPRLSGVQIKAPMSLLSDSAPVTAIDQPFTHILKPAGTAAFEEVRKLTFENASAWNIVDRGLLRTGMAADIVVFDEPTVKPCRPTLEHDLPGGVRRLVQKAEGIEATIVNGAVTLENGDSTGAVPGTLIRGPLAA